MGQGLGFQAHRQSQLLSAEHGPPANLHPHAHCPFPCPGNSQRNCPCSLQLHTCASIGLFSVWTGLQWPKDITTDGRATGAAACT